MRPRKRTPFPIVACLTAALFLLVGSTLSFAQEKEGGFRLPPYEKYVLENGLTFYLMEQHEVPLVYLSAVFPAGAVYDGGKSGLAFLTAESLLFGTKSYTKSEIEETIDFYGAALSTGSSMEYAGLSFSAAVKDLDKLLPIVKEVIVEPAFDQEEFEKRKQRLLFELDQAKESPRRVIGLYFAKFLYEDHPYGNPPYGTKASLEALSIEDAAAFYKEHYFPEGSAIAVVGDFQTEEIKAKINGLFACWTSEVGKRPESTVSPLPEHGAGRILLVDKDDSIETTFNIGSYGITWNNPDYVGVQVINTILGGRFTSWLNDELRVNAGLTYGARSFFNTHSKSGHFIVSSYTRTEFTVQALDLALSVLDRLHTKGVDEETLESAKNYVKGQFPPDYETSGQLASLLTTMFAFGLGDSFINDFQKNVESLTTEKAKEIIDKYFPREKLQFVLIGKASEIRDAVTKYGILSEKEITTDGF